MKIAAITAILVLGIVGADAPPVPVGPDAIAVKKHNAAIAHANQVYARLLTEADKQYVADLQTADATAARLKNSGDAIRITQEISAANAELAGVEAIASDTVALVVGSPPDVIDPNDPMAAAIKHHQIVKGMTEKQMRQAMEFPRPITKPNDETPAHWDSRAVITQANAISTYVWHIGKVEAGSLSIADSRVVTATVQNGIVTAVEQTRDELTDHEPE